MKYDDENYIIKDSVLTDITNNYTEQGSTTENILLNLWEYSNEQIQAQYFYNTMLIIVLIVLVLRGEKK